MIAMLHAALTGLLIDAPASLILWGITRWTRGSIRERQDRAYNEGWEDCLTYDPIRDTSRAIGKPGRPPSSRPAGRHATRRYLPKLRGPQPRLNAMPGWLRLPGHHVGPADPSLINPGQEYIA